MSFPNSADNESFHLSLPEILSTIVDVGGQYLMQRNRRIGGPLGAGLSTVGQLGEALAQRHRQQNLAKIISKMPGVTPEMQQSLSQAVKLGMDPASIYGDVLKEQFKGKPGLKPFPIWDPKTQQESMFDPNVPGATIPSGSYSSSFKPSAPKETEAEKLDLYGKERQIAQQYQKPPQPSWRTETDPTTGATVQNAYRYNPKTGMMEEVPTSGSPSGVPAKLDTNERKQLDAVHLVSTQIPRMNDLVQQLPPDTSPALLAREYAKFRAPFGALGTVDPRFGAYFQQIGQLKAALISSAASGFRGQYMIDMLKQHIPSETDPPSRAMEKIRGFDEGGFNAVLKNYLGTGTSITPSTSDGGSSSGGTPPKPPFEVDKTYQKDGQWYVKDKAGKFFQFDGSKWTPL